MKPKNHKNNCSCCICKKGGFDVHSLLGLLPRPSKGFVLPNHKYTGPWNPLHTQLDENDNPLPGQEPFNQVDETARKHDICYRDHPASKLGCDRIMLGQLNQIQPQNLRERFDKFLVSKAIGVKAKLGVGYHINNNTQPHVTKHFGIPL